MLHVEYNGTCDVLLPRLFVTSDELMKHWREDYDWEKCPHQPEVAEAAVTYGDGITWLVKACRVCAVVVDVYEPYRDGDDVEVARGLPVWFYESQEHMAAMQGGAVPYPLAASQLPQIRAARGTPQEPQELRITL